VTVDASGMLDGVVRPTLRRSTGTTRSRRPSRSARPSTRRCRSSTRTSDRCSTSGSAASRRGSCSPSCSTWPTWPTPSATRVATSAPIPLGGYQVLPRADAGYIIPTVGGEQLTSIWDLADVPTSEGGVPELHLVKNIIGNLSRMAGGSGSFEGKPFEIPPAPAPSTATSVAAPPSPRRSASPTGMSLGEIVSFPILDDPLSAAVLLFGEDAPPVSFIEIAPPPIDFGYNAQVLAHPVRPRRRLPRGEPDRRPRGRGRGRPARRDGLQLARPDQRQPAQRALPRGRLRRQPRPALHRARWPHRGQRRRFGSPSLGVAEARSAGRGYVRLEAGLDLFDESLTIPRRPRGRQVPRRRDRPRRAGPPIWSAARPRCGDAVCIFRPVVQLDAGLAFSGEASGRRREGVERLLGGRLGAGGRELVVSAGVPARAPRRSPPDPQRRALRRRAFRRPR
jgi:hypothetical protein